ncbi:hypothetical protein EUGRSUZ_J00430 [Eucalyptus grandis]|uniref:Uncharacterized protein n=2 Tax=Eucalyptus grandis TaxID=71139 RepID=A0ACC3J269_EUCGR|nr:hypothetical protein EUGRSUZ_J00430 [Eucalyptus grandis]
MRNIQSGFFLFIFRGHFRSLFYIVGMGSCSHFFFSNIFTRPNRNKKFTETCEIISRVILTFVARWTNGIDLIHRRWSTLLHRIDANICLFKMFIKNILIDST